VKKERCPKCAAAGGDQKGDNLVDFGASKHCFACGFHVTLEEVVKTSSKKKQQMPSLVPATTYPGRSYLSPVLKSWGILAEPIKGYSRKHKNLLVFPYFRDSVLVGLKGRNFDKPKDQGVFWYQGYADVTVFGTHVVTGSDCLIITEGEPDALCLSLVLGDEADIWAISGTGNVKKLKDLMPVIRRYKEVYLGLDADEAGESATAEALEILPSKTKLIDWQGDVCETFERLGHNAVIDCIEGAKSAASNSLLSGESITTSYITHLKGGKLSGLVSSYEGLDAMLGGSLKRGECLLLAAHTGMGKSTFALNWAYSIIANQDVRVLWCGSEMLPEEMVHKTIECDLRKSVLFVDGVLNTPFSEIEDSLKFVEKHFHFYTGAPSVDEVIKAAEVLVDSGLALIVIDVIDDYISNDWKVSRTEMKKLKDFALGDPRSKRPPVAVIAVSHTVKNNEGRYNKSLKVTDLAGGTQRIQQATCVIGMDGVVGEPQRTLKLLKLPRMGDSLVSEVNLTYEGKVYYEVD